MEKISNEKLKKVMIYSCCGVIELAKKTGLQPSHISRLLKDNTAIRLPTLGKISKALNISADDLLLKE